ncbi:MAG: type II toxin-antitoxin system RelE/ParE family toxin [Caulobacteraceae bacterium]
MAARLTPRAQADIEEIWDYTAARWGPSQAEVYVAAIGNAIDRLARDARLGGRCDDIREGYFKMSVESHVIFFRRADSDIEVVRVLHARMDFPRRLG